MPMNDGIAARLRMARAYAKLRQQDVADAAGVHLTTVQRAEAGTLDPRRRTLTDLAKALGVRVEWLLTGEGAMAERKSDDRDRTR